MNRWKVPDAATTIKATMESNQARGVQLVATTMLNPPAGAAAAGVAARRSRRSSRSLLDRGATIYNEAVLRLPCPGWTGHAEA